MGSTHISGKPGSKAAVWPSDAPVCTNSRGPSHPPLPSSGRLAAVFQVSVCVTASTSNLLGENSATAASHWLVMPVPAALSTQIVCYLFVYLLFIFIGWVPLFAQGSFILTAILLPQNFIPNAGIIGMDSEGARYFRLENCQGEPLGKAASQNFGQVNRA